MNDHHHQKPSSSPNHHHSRDAYITKKNITKSPLILRVIPPHPPSLPPWSSPPSSRTSSRTWSPWRSASWWTWPGRSRSRPRRCSGCPWPPGLERNSYGTHDGSVCHDHGSTFTINKNPSYVSINLPAPWILWDIVNGIPRING